MREAIGVGLYKVGVTRQAWVCSVQGEDRPGKGQVITSDERWQGKDETSPHTHHQP